MTIQTVKTDVKGTRVLTDYDAINVWLEQLTVEFVSAKDNVNPFSIPSHRDRDFTQKIFERANDEERRMIFNAVVTALIRAKREVLFERIANKEIPEPGESI